MEPDQIAAAPTASDAAPAAPAASGTAPGAPGTAPTPSPDIRLVVSDLDGTLLDADGRLPEGFWEFHAELEAAGVAFAPATGRQLAAVRQVFGTGADRMTVIAENGSVVVRGGELVHVSELSREVVAAVVETVAALRAAGADIGATLGAVETAYVDRTDERFLDAIHEYYADTTTVADLAHLTAPIVKIAVFAFGDAGSILAEPLREAVGDAARVVVSAHCWVDVMTPTTNKGGAVRSLQADLGVDRSQTAAFGDYFNDVEMLDAAEHSRAMAGAPDGVKAHAARIVGSNDDGAVLTEVRRMLRR